MKKITIIILAIILIGGLFFLQEPKNEHVALDGWKTIEVKDFGYRIDVPNEAEIEILEENDWIGSNCLLATLGKTQIFVSHSGETCGEPTGIGINQIPFEGTISTTDESVIFEAEGFNEVWGNTNFFEIKTNKESRSYKIIVYQDHLFSNEQEYQEQNNIVADIINSISENI